MELWGLQNLYWLTKLGECPSFKLCGKCRPRERHRAVENWNYGKIFWRQGQRTHFHQTELSLLELLFPYGQRPARRMFRFHKWYGITLNVKGPYVNKSLCYSISLNITISSICYIWPCGQELNLKFSSSWRRIKIETEVPRNAPALASIKFYPHVSV